MRLGNRLQGIGNKKQEIGNRWQMIGAMKRIVFSFSLLLCAVGVKAQIIAVNTDVVSDACLAPNIGVELGMNSRSSLSVNALYGNNILGKDIKMTVVQPEWRYYFSGRTMYRHFIGVGALAASYDMKVDDRIYNGDGAGLGVTFGYVLPLSNRLNIDFHAGCGLFFYSQKEYHIDEDYSKYMDGEREVANSHGSGIWPTRIGISVTYILK